MTDVCVQKHPDGDVIGDHDWQPKEIRLHLHPRTYKPQGWTGWMECAHCGARRTVSGTGLPPADHDLRMLCS